LKKERNFLANLKLYSDYLGYRDDLNRYETWDEAVDDVMNTHRKKYSHYLQDLEPYLKEATEAYKEKRFLASQRMLQFRGDSLFNHEFKAYNCLVLYSDKPSYLGNAFYLLLCGCGVGLNMMTPFVDLLPPIQSRTKGTKTFKIPDNIEGWAQAAHILVNSYLSYGSSDKFKEYNGYVIKFDYSEIRPRGSRVGRRFKAPGPDGLQKSFEQIEALMNSYVEDFEKPFSSLIAYDIFMHLSDAVLSGGVRRSACSIIISPEDHDLVNAKVGNWREKNPQRARSNNSVGLLRHKFTEQEFRDLVEKNDGMSDLGFVFLNNIYEILNPCVIGETWVNTSEGVKQVYDLIDRPFNAVVDGKEYSSKGFWLVGSKKSINLKFKSGRDITLTNGHMLKLQTGQWMRAEDIRMGEAVLLNNNRTFTKPVDYSSPDFSKGYLVGSVIGDGNFSKLSAEIKFWDNKSEMHSMCLDHLSNAEMLNSRHREHKESKLATYSCLTSNKVYDLMKDLGCVTDSGDKILGDSCLKQSSEFTVGFLQGYFDADGSVQGNIEKGVSIRLTSSDMKNMKNVQELLLSLGIVSTIYKDRQPEGYRTLPDGKGGQAQYWCRAGHELVISRDSILEYQRLINFSNPDKKKHLSELLDSYSRSLYKSNFYDEVTGIEDAGYQMVYDCSVEDVHAFSANGLVAHNCFEIGFTPLIFDYSDKSIMERIMKSDPTLLTDGSIRTAIQCCNLNEGNAQLCKTEKDFYLMCRTAAIVGTLQAGYTNFANIEDCLEDTIYVSQKEALLGVSISGWCNQPWLFNPEVLQKGAKIVLDTNEEVAKIIGINPTARATTVKPSGNSSVILGCASGIHPEHSEKYFRVMQLNKDTEVGVWVNKNMPLLLEEGVYSSNQTDYAVFVPIENDPGTLYKEELQGVKHLELIKLVKDNWVNYGKVEERCIVSTTSHNVSNTVIIDDREEIIQYLMKNQDSFTAVSFITLFGDKDYNQAPNTSVLTFEEIADKYGKGCLFASGIIVDGLHYFNQNLWDACEHILYNKTPIGTREQVLLKNSWIARVKKFAKNYFKNDINRTIYCLKDVHLCHKWESITREMKDVDFTEILKAPVYLELDTMGAQACHGGSCEIVTLGK